MNVNNITGSSRVDEVDYIVLDFETVTPKGRAPEPIELAAMHIIPGLKVDNEFSFNHLIKPPEGAPITAFDTNQTGIRWEDVEYSPKAEFILADFERSLRDREYIMVAQNANYEASIIKRFSNVCPRISRMHFIDTVALAKHLLPRLMTYKLDNLAYHFSIPIPLQRHRALPDVVLTVAVFQKLLELGLNTKRINHIIDLRRIAEIKGGIEDSSSQISLFSFI